MSSADFDSFCLRAKENFDALLNQEIYQMSARPKGLDIPAIYVFYEDKNPVYVGRTNKLSQRLQAHVNLSHNSASFALKRTRMRHEEIRRATYKKILSRSDIVNHSIYGATFSEEIQKIKGMGFRFLKVENHIEQYLTELYVTMALDLSTDGFDNS
ncbi:GIY-YIG nuclease family protein [Leisingera aquaemixtae]|uniref:GIY-YIG nuclease family protein n=1 Tax=Leisingera aquaemixtae TaxID=1396826 RepID=A0ABY5WMD5_9RHOB|nr:GIY-YIG nuclease family protein [Leisingera aquaemixtae]UWQ26053.1 GIY-YIG nuclease family protein [Leisingera aquaemixtae]UWQ42676.1 GIY-YIG nuclease family protein [Leisingera aquaemixtae]